MSEISLVRIENQKKKAKEYMEVEKKLGYRPRVARYPYNVVDALFSLDKQDMGKWFNSLQNNYNKYYYLILRLRLLPNTYLQKDSLRRM